MMLAPVTSVVPNVKYSVNASELLGSSKYLLADLEANVVDLVVIHHPVVSGHEVPVLAVELHTAGLVGDAADPEVLHVEAIVNQAELEVLADPDLVVEAGEAENARNRYREIFGQVFELALRPKAMVPSMYSRDE